uniref:Uncharacterized protein n=1 Tax=Meloidogyne enterolobii TaxID=390850 RepID=A0A6V7X285_MELEN|nr:unnamed protein product [Meloidogyne enterolobii]
MPDTLELDSSWTVALSNIIYPFSFSLLGDSEEQESITVFRRYGNELLPIRIEIPDLSYASEEALEESINAVLLDVWKKELDREREEKRLEENKKRIYGNFRKRRDADSIRDQYEKHGYFDLNSNELNKFIKLLSEEDDAVSPKLTNLSPGEGDRNIRLLPPANQKSIYLKVIDKFILPHQTQLEPEEQLIKNSYFDMTKQIAFNFMKFLGKEGIRLPPISPLAVDGIEMVRFNPHSDQRERIKQALLKFKNPASVDQTEKKVASVNSQEITLNQHHKQNCLLLRLKDRRLISRKSLSFNNWIRKDILIYQKTGAKLPNVSTVEVSSVETVRLEPQTDQKDLIMNAIKRFMSSSPSAPIQQPETTDSAPSEEEIIVKNDQENSNEIEETEEPSPTILKTPITPAVTSPIIEAPLTPETPVEAPPTPEIPVTSPIIEAPPPPVTSPIIDAPPETPVTTPEEKQLESNDKTPLDGKITPLTYVEETDEKPLLTDDQKVLMEMAVRAATRAWRNSVELAEQAQINMELGAKYWQNARFKYALKDSVITLKETGETVHLRKTPKNILEWVKSQLILLTNRKIAIDKWTQECLEYGKRASEAQLETEAAESRGDVTEARKAADRAKAAESKVKEAASQVEEAVAGQKRLSEKIIGKVDAELAKQDKETSPESPTIEDERKELLEENIDENIEEYDENEVTANEELWTPPLPEENIEQNKEYESQEEETEVEDLTLKESQTIINEDEWTTPLPDEENIIKEQELPTIIEEVDEDETPKESQTITDEDEKQWTPPLPEENIEEPKLIEEATEEEDERENPPEETNDQEVENWTPPLPEEKNIEEPTIIEEATEEEDAQENPPDETKDQDEEHWTPPLPEDENIEEPMIIEAGTEEEDTQQESQNIADDDKEQWTPGLEDPVSIPPSPANLLENIVQTKVDEISHKEERPSLPRPEILIVEPPERSSYWKSFFGHGGVSDKTKEKAPLSQEKVEKEEPHKEKLTIRVDDSDPNVKKMHFAKYAYPPEYLKMLLSFSNIQLADPKYQWVSIHFDKLHKRFHVFLQGNVQYIQLSRQLAYTLGYDSEKVHSGQVAKYMPDISGGVRQFLVYAPRLVENSIIGNVTAPLLRVVNVNGKPGDSISEVYMTEHQHRILGKRHPDITIEIRTLAGKLVKFHWGTCILTLHFQRSLF